MPSLTDSHDFEVLIPLNSQKIYLQEMNSQ